MTSFVWLLIFLLVVAKATAITNGPPTIITFSVPNGYENKKSLQSSELPFYPSPRGNPSARYQQIYAASQFSEVPPQGAFIYTISFRAGCGGQTFVWVSNLVARMATTALKPDELGPRFDDNLPANTLEVVRRSRAYLAPGANNGNCNPVDPASHNVEFYQSPSSVLGTAFFYEPSRGNLLLDLTMPGIENLFTPPSPRYEVVDAPNDSVSRAVAFPSTAPTAQWLDSAGLVTQFQFAPIPTIRPGTSTNGVVLEWDNLVPGFRLQVSEDFSRQDAWRLYSGSVSTNSAFGKASIPKQNLTGKARYFRLFWDTPQQGLDDFPAPVQSATAPSSQTSDNSSHVAP